VPEDATGPIEYVAPLTSDDRLRVRYRHRRGVPIDILVQLECLIGGVWLPVRRYDTHHGLHVHTAPWDDKLDRRVPMPNVPLKDALNLAIDDIKVNRERYRAACKRA
jgi:hypothetical protein